MVKNTDTGVSFSDCKARRGCMPQLFDAQEEHDLIAGLITGNEQAFTKIVVASQAPLAEYLRSQHSSNDVEMGQNRHRTKWRTMARQQSARWHAVRQREEPTSSSVNGRSVSYDANGGATSGRDCGRYTRSATLDSVRPRSGHCQRHRTTALAPSLVCDGRISISRQTT